MEMSSLLDSVSVSGQHVLLAAQKLSIQPSTAEHREELITATQNVFLGVVKVKYMFSGVFKCILKINHVLLVDDYATVRRVVSAADQVLEFLSDLGSSSDIKSLLKSFQVFSEALLVLHGLTVERANSLQDPTQTEHLLDSLETLRRCVSMLHTAMCTTIKHPTSEQAQAAKTYILDKVQSTVSDIVRTLKSECHPGSLGPCGYYTERRNSLLKLLTCFSTSSLQCSSFDILVRDLVFHCMATANTSRREFQQRVVGHCRYILQFWSEIRTILKSSVDPDHSQESLEKNCTVLVQQIQMLDKTLMTTVLYEVLDTFLTASSTFEELLRVTRQIQASDSSTEMDLIFIQPLVEDFISSTDRITQVAHFVSAMAVDAKSLESVENSRACLTRLRGQIAALSLELADNSVQTVQKLHELCLKWEEETSQLQDALSDVTDVREFTSIAINEIIYDRHGCDAAYREQSYKLFLEHGTNLICHMKLMIHSVRRHVDRSDNPVYRNGLLVLLKQVHSSQTKVSMSWHKGDTEIIEAAEPKVNMAAVAQNERGNMEPDVSMSWLSRFYRSTMIPPCHHSRPYFSLQDDAGSNAYKEASSLTYTSLYLKRESNSWDPKDNRIVQVTRKMADTICYMTQYLRKKGPILVRATRDVISNCQSVTQFIRVIANHCLDKQCTVELSLIFEQILTITNQLNIISRSNAQNLLQTVLCGVHAAETACITVTLT
uniref:Uncharacterized protein n=1 Tax=Anabas testudineus TaxID=64144 RepID=A0A3Q1J8X5_ANATE